MPTNAAKAVVEVKLGVWWDGSPGSDLRVEHNQRPQPMDASGIPACSRWLSEATPPGIPPTPAYPAPHPGRDASDEVPPPMPSCRAGIPPGCGILMDSASSGPVVSLRSTTGYKLPSLRDGARAFQPAASRPHVISIITDKGFKRAWSPWHPVHVE